MHILLIHQAFAGLDEAGGTRHFEMARYLVERGHQVTVIASSVSYLTGRSRTSRWIERETPIPGIEIIRTYTYPAFHRSFFHRIISFFSFMVSSFIVGLGVHRVDLIWGTSPPIFQGATAWLIAWLRRLPFLFEVRDLWPAFAIAMGVIRNPILIRSSFWLENFLYHRADRIMVNSPGFIDHVRQHGAKPVDLIPNGADPAMFISKFQGNLFRQEHQLENQFIILYAGAHGISNDLGVVLNAAVLLKERKDICFVFVGDGKEKKNLQTQAKTMALPNVMFLPPVPKNEMNEVIAAANACVAILKPLDLYKTTFPNKVFDYMAAGRPVILAIDGVIREMVESAQAGIFVSPGDSFQMAQAIETLADHPEFAIKLGSAGCNYIEKHYNRSIISEQLSVLIENMRRKNG